MKEFVTKDTPPCPFCGSLYLRVSQVIVLSSEKQTNSHVICLQCNTRGPAGESEESAIESWKPRFGQHFRDEERIHKLNAKVVKDQLKVIQSLKQQLSEERGKVAELSVQKRQSPAPYWKAFAEKQRRAL